MTWRSPAALTLALLAGRVAVAQESDAPHVEGAHQWRLGAAISTVYYPYDVDVGLRPTTIWQTPPGAASQVPTISDGPFQDVFGIQHRLLIEGEADRDLYQGLGSFGIGVGGSYVEFDGTALHNSKPGYVPTYVQSGDPTSFHMAELRLLAIYRFDYFVPQKIPLVPYAKAGLDWVYYWNQLSSNKLTPNVGGPGEAQGLITGVEASLGLSLLVDVIDPVIAREMYRDSGIAHTYLNVGYTWQDLENGPSNLVHAIFTGGSPPSPTLNLSSHFLDFGVSLEF